MTIQRPTPQDDRPEAEYDVPPVRRAFSLLRHIAKGNRCRNVARTAADLGINRTTLLRLLHTLERENMIEQDRDGGGYTLSFGLLELTAKMRSSANIPGIARPYLSKLGAATGLSAHLGMLSGVEVIVLVRETPGVALVSNIHEGSRLPAHATVMGRIILAHMPRPDVHRLLADVMAKPGHERMPVTPAELDKILDDNLAWGVSWSVANYEQGIGSCAAAILDSTGRAVAAISVSGPAQAFEQEQPGQGPISLAVKETARQLTLAVHASAS